MLHYTVLYLFVFHYIHSIISWYCIILYCILPSYIHNTVLYYVTSFYITPFCFFFVASYCIVIQCIALHCFLHCILLCCVVLCCIRNSMYQSATMWKKRGAWSAHCAVWCCSCLLCRHFSGFLDMKDVPMYVLQLFRKESWRTWKCLVLSVSWGSTCIEILEDKLFAHWLDDRPLHQCTDVTDGSKSNKSLSQTMHSSHIWPMGVFWNIEATPTLIGRRNSGIYHFLPWILDSWAN